MHGLSARSYPAALLPGPALAMGPVAGVALRRPPMMIGRGDRLILPQSPPKASSRPVHRGAHTFTEQTPSRHESGSRSSLSRPQPRHRARSPKSDACGSRAMLTDDRRTVGRNT
jgi:hypothetical protein